MYQLITKTAVAIMALTLLTSCTSLGMFKKTARPMIVSLAANSTVNENISGQASPLVVTIYQLKDITLFNSLDFFSLYQNPEASLNNDLIDQQQIVMLPNQTQKITLQINNKTQYIGVVAAFNNITNTQWRNNYKLNKHNPRSLTINLMQFSININN